MRCSSRVGRGLDTHRGGRGGRPSARGVPRPQDQEERSGRARWRSSVLRTSSPKWRRFPGAPSPSALPRRPTTSKKTPGRSSKTKALDLIAANRVDGPGTGFAAEDNALDVYWASGGMLHLAYKPKRALAKELDRPGRATLPCGASGLRFSIPGSGTSSPCPTTPPAVRRASTFAPASPLRSPSSRATRTSFPPVSRCTWRTPAWPRPCSRVPDWGTSTGSSSATWWG